MIEYPCHKLPKDQWCDSKGGGGFMGHTCDGQVERKTHPLTVTSFELKLALLEYFRFERQWIAVDEFKGADVIADTGKKIIEVEVKTAKNDLVNGERQKKLKHINYAQGKQHRQCHPNEYLFCVPFSLMHDANMVIEELNPKYGLFVFYDQRLLRDLGQGYRADRLSDYLSCTRRPKKLHKGYPAKQQQRIAKRCSSKLITQMQEKYRDKVTFIGAR